MCVSYISHIYLNIYNLRFIYIKFTRKRNRKRDGETYREFACTAFLKAYVAGTGPEQNQELGDSKWDPLWVSWIPNYLRFHLLPPRVPISRMLKSGREPRLKPRLFDMEYKSQTTS